MCITVLCQLLCKPNCCGESLNAAQGAVYLGRGWFLPPHWNTPKGLWKPVWCLVSFFSSLLSRSVFLTKMSLTQWALIQLAVPPLKIHGWCGGKHSLTATAETCVQLQLGRVFQHDYVGGWEAIEGSCPCHCSSNFRCLVVGAWMEGNSIWRIPLTFRCNAQCIKEEAHCCLHPP